MAGYTKGYKLVALILLVTLIISLILASNGLVYHFMTDFSNQYVGLLIYSIVLLLHVVSFFIVRCILKKCLYFGLYIMEKNE